VLGLMVGAVFSCVSLVSSAALADVTGDAFFGIRFSPGSIIIWPIFYSFMGFIDGIITGVIYNNIVAGWVGGIEMEIN
jgi:hypothetical protein